MVTAQPSSIWEKLPYEIMEMEFKRSQLRWWQFQEKRYLTQRIEAYKAMGWNMGVDIALNDLRDAGIIK
jgi:hypothetical protein